MRRRKHDEELVAPVAGDHVGVAHRAFDDLSHAAEDRVAERAPAALVLHLEPIDVEDAAGERLGVLFGARELERQSVVERDEGVAVHVAAAVTHTIGGLQVDTKAHVAGPDGLWAAGVDVGGVATGGYGSGLAQALVLGLAAADSIAGTR